VVGVDVGAIADPAATVRSLAVDVAALAGLPAPAGDPWLVRDQVGDGYGAPTTACRAAIRMAARTEGLLLDPVYSGKALAGLRAMAGGDAASRPAGVRPSHRAIVFLATGGTPALFASRYAGWLVDEA
jgi:D-cysteine desulfhydrase